MFSLFVCFAAVSGDFLCGGHTSCKGTNPKMLVGLGMAFPGKREFHSSWNHKPTCKSNLRSLACIPQHILFLQQGIILIIKAPHNWIWELPNNNGSGICLRGSTKDNKWVQTQPSLPLHDSLIISSLEQTQGINHSPKSGYFYPKIKFQTHFPPAQPGEPHWSTHRWGGRGRRGGRRELITHWLHGFTIFHSSESPDFSAQFSPWPHEKCTLREAQPSQTGF